MNTTTLNSLNTPTAPMIIKVRIEDIKPFNRDPRRAPNEKYGRILESIRIIGLQQQLSITKRPNEDHYTLRSGGATRLKALKELYAETGEERFGVIDCRFVPYTTDLDLLSLHISENKNYAEMSFIDVALVIKKMKGMVESDTGKTISLHELNEEMKQQGWIVNEFDLPYYIYATEIKDELPIAFAHGLDQISVVLINTLEKHVKHWATEKNIDINQCVQVYKAALRKNDREIFSIGQTKEDLIDGLSNAFKLNRNDIGNILLPLQKNVITENHGVTNNG